MTLSAAEKLRRFYDSFEGDNNVLILINADPDSIASAMAVKRLLWRKVSSVTISNINIIKRPDNIAMIRLLGVDLVPIKNIVKDSFNRFVIVDSQPNHNEIFTEYPPHVIIDHHPDTGASAPFVDIRPKYGATATIMTEYLRAAKIKPSSKLATGLFYAIKTDTDNFVRQTLIEDVRAFQFLYRHSNLHLINKIEQSELTVDFLKYFKIALDNKRVIKGHLFAHLGPVVNPDICVIIADFFLKISSVNWSIVSGLYSKKLIIVFRNDGLRKDAGKVAKQSFGQIGSAGGHKSMARAEIPFTDLKEVVDYKDDKKLLRWIINKIEKKAGKK
ncbi:MAG: DHH family phosphoesterase [Proteobacteria bacterium]|jgi:nanoRNase/pAp phosphatase (c-di-AMP/oligoRNAs hydrolase)|nr:DHH family phosphoesterase [Pseudomonadota bacterium]OEU69413.1 MAG: phosphoesterase [Desulfobacterales bacterium S5133MH16]